MTTTHVTDQAFPFKATLTHPVGDFEVGDSVTVVGYDDEPHTYVVKHGKREAGGVSPLWFEFTAIEDPNAVDPTRDPVAEAREASRSDAEELFVQQREEAEAAAAKASKSEAPTELGPPRKDAK